MNHAARELRFRHLNMNTIQEIESAVAKLSREELAAFRDWFREFDADAWDKPA
jgi:hypothetical protein